MIEHLGHEQVARIFIAFMQALLGVLQLASPGCFSGTGMYFRGARESLTPQERDRLEHVLEARRQVEGDTYAATRWSGIFAIAVAPLVLIPAVPYVLPYAASCLVLAFATLVAYVQLRRATERRAYRFGRQMTWPQVAVEYGNLFLELAPPESLELVSTA